VGSLPVFTNFWDLCVRPEFQELFRTTTNRLVTEAHKDFCANTAFRWDIYAKDARPLGDVDQRLRDVDDFHFHAPRAGITLPHQVNLGVVTSTVQGPLYERLLAVLSERAMRLSELVRLPGLDGVAPADVVRGVDAGVAMGLFDITAGPVDGPARAVAEPERIRIPGGFNRAVLAADALGGRPVALASEATGTGHTLGDLDAAILLELAEGGSTGLAERVDARLVRGGRSLQRDGQPVNDPAERTALVGQACDAFRANLLPGIMRLGIATEA
jgi:hypothetical protein